MASPASEEIQEVLLQSAIYCGVLAANFGLHIAEEIFAQLDAQPSATR